MYRPLMLAATLALAACQGQPRPGAEDIAPGTRLILDRALTLPVTGYGAALQGGEVVAARDQTVWLPLCRLETRTRHDPALTLPPGTLEVADVRTWWRFNEISVNVYNADLALARPYHGVTGLHCEVWGGPHWKDGVFGLAELRGALGPTFRVIPAP